MSITEHNILTVLIVQINRKYFMNSRSLMILSSLLLFVLLIFISKQSIAEPIEKLTRGTQGDNGYLYAITNGEQYQVAKLFGANVPSLMMVEDPSPMKYDGAQFRSPTEFEVNDIIETLQRMGVNLVRIYPPSIAGGGFSEYMHNNDYAHVIGFDKNKQGAAAITFDADNLAALKRTLHLLDQSGIQVVIPMIDYWCYWGGIQNFVDMVDAEYGDTDNKSPCYINGKPNLDTKKVAQFFTQDKYINAYKSYVLALTQELKEYQNIIWETGNELGAEVRYNQIILNGIDSKTLILNDETTASLVTLKASTLWKNLDSWTQNIAAFIKENDPSHLLMDGRFGVSEASIDDPNIDILSNHYYQFWGMATLYEYDLAKINHKKPYFAGEFLCFAACTYDFMDRFQQHSDEGSTVFAAFWSLRGHADQGRNADTFFKDTGRTGIYTHFEENGFSGYHYPGADVQNSPIETDTHKEIMQRFSEAAVQFSGMKRDDPLADVQIGELVETATGTQLIWAGVAGAEGYCVYKDGQFIQNVKFIGVDGQPFSGLSVTDRAGYSITAYKPNSDGCGNAPTAPEEKVSLLWNNPSITQLTVDGHAGIAIFSQTAILIHGTTPLTTQVQYRCFTLDNHGNTHHESCEVLGNGQLRLQELSDKVTVVVEAYSHEYQLTQQIQAHLPLTEPVEPIFASEFHCPAHIFEENSLLGNDNKPKFDGGSTWPYYLANSNNIANTDVPFGTVKAEIDSRSPNYLKALCRYPEGTRQAAGRIQGCLAVGAGFSDHNACEMKP
ncbi:cellulase family glycosylhydrolase [uncultured Shewanella sp.]|uniref:cellulase family glycosylhydrolase n=1 Tax=uncultured Shewanella sp. TaxID=173975 RepID=UPI00261D06E5|nr:cellulase family glycosylhydrolase [uncultured Shewanella sp.]